MDWVSTIAILRLTVPLQSERAVNVTPKLGTMHTSLGWYGQQGHTLLRGLTRQRRDKQH